MYDNPSADAASQVAPSSGPDGEDDDDRRPSRKLQIGTMGFFFFFFKITTVIQLEHRRCVVHVTAARAHGKSEIF